jgi:hypothetical protein
LEEYLARQGRYKHLEPEQTAIIQTEVDRAWSDLEYRVRK